MKLLSMRYSARPLSCLSVPFNYPHPQPLLHPNHSVHQNNPHRKNSTQSPYSDIIQRITIPAPHLGHILILKLNNERSRNAISTSLLASLASIVSEIQAQAQAQAQTQVPGPAPLSTSTSSPDTTSDRLPTNADPTRALILSSAIDTAFCAGADLKERLTFSTAQTRDFLTLLRGTFDTLAKLPIPTISAVSSLALGGGLELALTTTFRVFASSALVALPETRLGIIPGAGGMWRLPRLIGRGPAADMTLTGRRVGGAEAYFLGLCERLVEVGDEEGMKPALARERVLDAAVKMATDICEGGPVATRAFMEGMSPGGGRGRGMENRCYEAVLETWDREEALRAFKEKRKPVFRGC
ncbi:hypothetical protein MMC09_002428 [Bachmanniomyces sp. S44760]|nr:hypothetical protein [Bachmanniomyces sp. S44760]